MVAIAALSFGLGTLLSSGIGGIYAFTTLGMLVFGLNYGVLGTVLAAQFPTPVRYTGSSIAFNLAGIFGASLAPYIATWLQASYGISYVGYYLLASALITLGCIVAADKTDF